MIEVKLQFENQMLYDRFIATVVNKQLIVQHIAPGDAYLEYDHETKTGKVNLKK